MLSGLALGHRRDVSVPLPCYEPSLELLLGHWEDWGGSPSPFALPELDKRTRGPAPRAEPSFEASGSHMVLLSVFSFFLW